MNKYVTIIAKGDGLFAMPDPANDDKLPTTLFPSRMILIIQKVFLVPLLEKFKMKFTFLLFSFAVANLFKATVDGALMIYDNVYCSRIAPNETATVCAVAQYLTPYPESFENGTIVWVGEYRSIYTIVKGLKEGDVYDAWVPGTVNDAGILIEVALGDADSENCTVKVSESYYSEETLCNKCEYCGEGSYKADCSNIKNGRNMTSCVKLTKDARPKDVIFFPFNASAVPKVISPVRAPVRTPRRSPVRAPLSPRTMSPTRAPRTMSPTRAPRTKSPTRAPRTMSPTRAPRTMSPTRAPRTMSPTRAPRTKSPARAPVTKPRTASVPTP